MAKKQKNDTPVLANNRRAFHDYAVLQRMEAGIQLSGTEVKSCRARAIQLQEGFITVSGGEAFLHNVHISHYDFGNRFNHDVRRMRRLLLHKKEIAALQRHLSVRGHAVVPLSFYLKEGLVKVEIGLAQGKHEYDRRDDIKKRDSDREIKRVMANFNKKNE
jgi:SsrA-binding protein